MVTLILQLLVLLAIITPVTAYDVTGTVSEVIDGDTFDVAGFGRVRLADVDCPEEIRNGGDTARNYTIEQLLDKQVYLDVDDKSEFDNTESKRFVCVVYINGTNFNKAVVDSGHGCIQDYTSNEFDPATWWDGIVPDSVCIEHPGGVSLNGTAAKVLGLSIPEGAEYVGSAKSNKYHLPGCRWAKRIKDSNQVWFSSAEDAKSKGYVPCGSCIGD